MNNMMHQFNLFGNLFGNLNKFNMHETNNFNNNHQEIRQNISFQNGKKIIKIQKINYVNGNKIVSEETIIENI